MARLTKFRAKIVIRPTSRGLDQTRAPLKACLERLTQLNSTGNGVQLSWVGRSKQGLTDV